MRKFELLCAAATSVVLGYGATAQANLLTNGNLDTTYQQEIVPGFFLPKPDSWVNTGTRTLSGPYEDEMSSEPWAGPAPTPDTNPGDFGVFFKPFTGNLTTGDLATGHLTQDVSVAPGATYTLTGWAGAEANYSGLIPGSVTKSEMALDFYGPGSSLLGSAVLDLKAAGLGSGTSAFGYKQFSVAGVAPAGSIYVRARVSMVDAYSNPAGGGQAFVVDDFNLVPEPASLSLLTLGGLALGRRRRA